MVFPVFVPKGAEDVAWWDTNRIRFEQQLQLGMLGPMSVIAGSVQPVAIIDDLSPLSTTAPLHGFGCWVRSQPAINTPVLEIHAPIVAAAGGPVDVFLQGLHVSAQNTAAHYALRIVDPSPTTDLAVITALATELDDAWGPYEQTHTCRVFAGLAPPGPALPVAPAVVDVRGFNVWEPYSWAQRLQTPLGLRIPRGKNLVVDSSVSNFMDGLTMSFGVLIREAQAPTGPA